MELNDRLAGAGQPRGPVQLQVLPVPAEQPIPHSVEAEEAVLGALLIDRETIARVATVLTPGDFFSQERAIIYRVVLSLYHTQEPGDLLLVREVLKQLNLLGTAEGQVRPAYLVQLMNQTGSPVHTGHYAEVVRRYSLARRLIGFGAETARAGYDPHCRSEPGQVLATLATELQELLGWWRRGQDQSYFLKHEATLEVGPGGGEDPRQPRQDGPVPLRFGFVGLDGQAPSNAFGLDGIEPSMLLLRSTLTAVVADTSVGKTILAEQIAEANAAAGANVLFFHNELSHDQMIWRRNNRLVGVPVWKQADRQRLSEFDRQQLAAAAGQVGQWPGRIDYVFCPDWSAKDIAEEARLRNISLSALQRRGYDLVVADYLQNMGVSEGWNESRAEKVAQNVHALHTLANELDLAVLFTSQLGRDGKREEGFIKPTLHGGLESGAIERHSNQVLGLWRDNTPQQAAELTCLKSTFGRRGWQLPLQFIESRLEFVE